ncbi:MAG: flavin reductase family protein [Planctomycetes bacterium]|nr:flavin reductase family protein [Planctomycetota bacterium]
MSDPPPPPRRRPRRVPTGLYVATTLHDGRPLGFVASFVMQTGILPPRVCVAVGKDRDHLAAMRATGAFTLSILDAASQGLMGTFFKPAPEGGTHYDGLKTETAPSGVPVLADALAWLDCKVCGEFNGGDHIVVFGEVTAGALQREGDPAIHLRKSGLGY